MKTLFKKIFQQEVKQIDDLERQVLQLQIRQAELAENQKQMEKFFQCDYETIDKYITRCQPKNLSTL